VSGTNVSIDANDFLEYAVECDEHLSTSRRILLAFEKNQASVNRGELDALFRAFHSIKGLSGMVGIRDAELLAHQMESFLDGVRNGQLPSITPAIVALLDGVQAIERIIIAQRDAKPPPAIDALRARLDDLLLPRPAVKAASDPLPPPASVDRVAAPLSPEKQGRLDAALRQGGHVWQVKFTPSAERAAAGLTVNVVRERLLAAGEIIHAEPRVVAGSGITFDFLVATSDEHFVAETAGDGLSIQPYVPPMAPPVGTIHDASAATAAPLAASNLVRVDLSRLDDLMRTVGELVITRAPRESD
jgi:two-component system, chemotaxis family, sensor kinase CheA